MLDHPFCLIEQADDFGLSLSLDIEIYPVSVIIRTAYWYTDRLYIYLRWENETKDRVIVEFRAKEKNSNLAELSSEFYNSLIDQLVRTQVEEETHQIRNVIIKRAFSEALSHSELDVEKEYSNRGA